MTFTVQEFHDLLHILEQHPVWRMELRRWVLTEELLALPQTVQALADVQRRTEDRLATLADAQRRTEDRLTRLEEAVTQLADAQRRTEEQVARLTGVVHILTDEVGELQGDNLERRYRERAAAYLARLVRRAHVLSTEELCSLLEGAVERGEISEAEAEEVTWADLVVRGRRRETLPRAPDQCCSPSPQVYNSLTICPLSDIL